MINKLWLNINNTWFYIFQDSLVEGPWTLIFLILPVYIYFTYSKGCSIKFCPRLANLTTALHRIRYKHCILIQLYSKTDFNMEIQSRSSSLHFTAVKPINISKRKTTRIIQWSLGKNFTLTNMATFNHH